MRHRFIHDWVAQQQRAYHQRTRGIMSPEDRRALEDEATRGMAEIERKVAEKAWDEGAEHVASTKCKYRTNADDPCPENPYRREETE